MRGAWNGVIGGTDAVDLDRFQQGVERPTGPDTSIAYASDSPRISGPASTVGAAMMTSIALLKTCGLWLPAALVPWSRFPRRAWLVAFVIAGAVLGEIVFYFPFEVVVFNGVEPTPEHPGTLLLLLFCVALAAPGFFLARLTRRHQPA